MGKSAAGGKMEVTEYRLSAHVSVALRLDSVRRVTIDEKEAFRGNVTSNTTLNINKPNLFGGEKKEGGLVGAIEVMLGDDTQLASVQLANRYGLAPSACPGFRGFTSLFFRGSGQTAAGYLNAWNVISGNWPGNVGGNGFLWRHNQPFIAQKIEVEGTCAPRTTLNQDYALIPNPDHADRPDANPAHMIWEAYVDDEFGMGTDPAGLDADAFEAASETLFDEVFGLSMLWTEQTEIEKIVDEILQHIQGTIFTDPDTGKITLKLHRFDYDVETLAVITPDNAKLSNWQVRSPGETVNELTVSWTNPENEQEESITGQVLAAIDSQDGQTVPGSRNYYAVRHAGLARTLLARDLRESTAPDLASCEAVLDRRFWNVKPGDVVKVAWPRRSAYERIMRVGKVNYGKPGSSTIRVSLAEDVFALELPPIAIDPGTGWVDPSADPSPLTIQLTTLPSFFTRNGALQRGSVDIERPEVLVMSLADSQDDDSLDYELVGEALDPSGETRILSRGALSMTPLSELTATLNAAATSELPALLFPDINWGPQIGGFVWFGYGDTNQEIALVTGRTETGWTLERGALDTIPRTWAAGTPVWCVNPGARVVDELTPQAAGATVVYRGLDRTSKGLLAYADAPDESATLTERPWLPLRPANVAVNGTAFGSLNVSAASTIEITWATRNRLLEDSQPLAWTDGSVAPEYRQETIVRFYDVATGDLVAEYPYLWLDTSISFAKTAFDRWSSVRVEVTSRRDDLEALQAHTVTLTGLAGNPAAPLPPAPAARTTPPQVFPAPAVDAFAAVAGSDEGPDGSSVPTIVVNGTQDDLDADHLVIRYKKTGTTVWRDHPSVPLNGEAVSVEITGVQPTTQYDVEVGYLFDGRPSVYRTLSDVTTGSIISGEVVPVVPGNISGTPTLSIASSLGSDGTVRVLSAGDWEDATNAIVYVVELDDGVTVRTLEFAESKFSEVPVIAGRTYRYRAKGKSGTGNLSPSWSSWSDSVAAGGDTTGPGPITSPTLTPFARRIVVRWVNPTDADYDGLDLARHTATTASPQDYIIAHRVRGTVFPDTTVAAGVPYHYYGRTVDRSGNPGSAWVYLGTETAVYINVGGGDIDPTDETLVTSLGRSRDVSPTSRTYLDGLREQLEETGQRALLDLQTERVSEQRVQVTRSLLDTFVQVDPVVGRGRFLGEQIDVDGSGLTLGDAVVRTELGFTGTGRIRQRFADFDDGTREIVGFEDLIDPTTPVIIGVDTPQVSGSVAETLQDYLFRLPIFPEQFGAVGNGITNDYAALQAALNTGRTVWLKRGSVYAHTSPLVYAADSQVMEGEGVLKPVGNIDCVQITNKIGCEFNGQFDGSAQTGGYLIHLNGGHRARIRKLLCTTDCANIMRVRNSNMVSLDWGWAVARQNGIYWDGTSSRSDIFLIDKMIVGLTGSGYGLIWDGNCHSLEIQYLGIVCRAGVTNNGKGAVVRNTSGGTAPAIGKFGHIEIDYPTGHGIEILAGSDYDFSDPYVLGAAGGSGIYVAATINTGEVRIDGGKLRGNDRYGIENLGGPVYYGGNTDLASNTLGQYLGNVWTYIPRLHLTDTFYLTDIGGNPIISFAPNDYFSYDVANNSLNLGIGGAIVASFDAAKISHTLKMAAPTFELGTNASLRLSGGAVFMDYDANDYASYDRANNTYSLVIGGVARFTVSTSLMESTLTFRAPRVEIDGNAYLTISSGSVLFGFDANDYLAYDRAGNQLNLVIDGTGRFSISTSLFESTLVFRAPRLEIGTYAFFTVDAGVVITGLDDNDYWGYDRAANQLNLVIGAVGKLSIGASLANFTIEVRSPRLSIDGNAYLTVSSGSVLLGFDANDYLAYDRAGNQLNLVIGGVGKLTASATLIEATVEVRSTRLSIDAEAYFTLNSGNTLIGLAANDYINFERATNRLSFVIGGVEKFSADTNGMTSERFSVDAAGYLTISSGNVVLGFDANDYLTYDRASNAMILYVGGAAAMTVSATGLTHPAKVATPRFEMDANAHLSLAAGVVTLAFDSTDFWAYDRATNVLGLTIGGASRLTVSTTAFTSTLNFNAPRLAVDTLAYLTLSSGNPMLSVDTNDYWIYDRTANRWGFYIGGTERLGLTATALESARFQIDANCWWTLASGNPKINFDTNDYAHYDRTANVFEVVIGSTQRWMVDATGAKSASFRVDDTFLTSIVSTKPRQTFDAGDFVEYDRTTNAWAWAIGGATRLSLSASGLTSGQGFFVDTNLSLALASSSPRLTVDSTDYLEFDRATNTWTWVIGDTARMILTADGWEVVGTAKATAFVLDANGQIALSAGNPLFALDTNDYFLYDRAANRASFYIGGTERLGITTLGIETARVNIDAGLYLTISGGNPLFVFDADDFLAYDRAANSLNLTIDGVTPVSWSKTKVTTNVPLLTTPVAVGSLPAGEGGMRAFVTDADAATWGAAVVGGGSNKVPVWHDGTGWKIG